MARKIDPIGSGKSLGYTTQSWSLYNAGGVVPVARCSAVSVGWLAHTNPTGTIKEGSNTAAVLLNVIRKKIAVSREDADNHKHTW